MTSAVCPRRTAPAVPRPKNDFGNPSKERRAPASGPPQAPSLQPPPRRKHQRRKHSPPSGGNFWKCRGLLRRRPHSRNRRLPRPRLRPVPDAASSPVKIRPSKARHFPTRRHHHRPDPPQDAASSPVGPICLPKFPPNPPRRSHPLRNPPIPTAPQQLQPPGPSHRHPHPGTTGSRSNPRRKKKPRSHRKPPRKTLPNHLRPPPNPRQTGASQLRPKALRRLRNPLPNPGKPVTSPAPAQKTIRTPPSPSPPRQTQRP